VNLEKAKVSVGYYKKEEHFFTGDSSPLRAVEGLEWLLTNQDKSWEDFQEVGYRNAALALRNLGIITNLRGKYILTEKYKKYNSALDIVWKAALADKALKVAKAYLEKNPTSRGKNLGDYLNKKFERNWSNASVLRTGNSLRQWARWLLMGENTQKIPKPLGERARAKQEQGQGQGVLL
jgi:hypothetical protein